ncbi:enoyl-CoA hydratase/isomerase family protein [Rhodococcus qingshengii]|uniref:enoyl-CoA hydratase/isomerase family protein n=1 Tax=Rhodococcus qingshengii TaxID=334542 RepID=UPI0010A5E8F7|nr:enoyl-CoA hydratase-related protein [Rhodococcus qingshengii]THJ67669.1 enoyl-CoA hydratase/isomerase family protein [Rhodococcus qingshengii]
MYVVTLTRPELLNRFDELLETELTRVVNDAAADPAARVVTLLAEGKVFSAGGDFQLMLECNIDIQARLAALQRARDLLAAITTLPVPFIVGVQGAAIGLGATVAVGADVVVASENARIADTHVAVGLTAGDGGALFWPQSMGMLRARRYLLTGDALDAKRAYEFGLVTDLVGGPAEVAPAALAIAERIAALPPLGVRGTKLALNQLTRQRAGEVVETALLWEGTTLASADLVEALDAFKEKRTGKYEGR